MPHDSTLDARSRASDVPRLLAAHAPAFRRSLLRWYRTHGRDLPWRRTRDPYAILVSEFMLQQTQVATVLPYYARWLARFPDFSSLAAALESDVLHAWQGLGYYARARNLQATARLIVQEHAGQFPEEPVDLPGVGRYTANAVRTFAFDHSVPVVEANIARLLARLTNLQLSIDSNAGRAHLWQSATELLPKRHAGEFNSALMDLGASVCVPRQPRCGACPVRTFCLATEPALLPRKKARAATQKMTEDHAWTTKAGRVLLEQAEERWRGMWILPRLPRPTGNPIYRAQFPFTHHQVTLAVHETSAPRGPRQKWFRVEEIAALPMPSPHRRALTHLLDRTRTT